MQVKQEYDSVGDAYDPTGFLGTDQLNPLEQWLYSAGPVCVPSSSSLGCPQLDSSSHFIRHYPADAIAGLQPVLQTESLDFIKMSYQGPQQNLPYNGKPSLPYDKALLDGDKLSQLMTESLLESGYHNSTDDVYAQRMNENYIGSASASSQPDILGSRAEPNPANFSRLSQHAVASTTELGTKDVPLDPKPNESSCLQRSNPSQDHSINVQKSTIKQHPEKEKAVSFQSIGLQDITLDDGTSLVLLSL